MMYREKHSWIYDVSFLLVLVLAGYLRFAGSTWGDGQGQHPDENTFSGVLGALRAQKCADGVTPVEACPPEQRRWLSLGDYFDSETSTLNPYNRGFGSYVYGDLPMVAIRVTADAVNAILPSLFGPDGPFGSAGIDYGTALVTDLRLFGRQASAFADLLAIIFLYFAAARLYDRRVALLAALFSTLAVMQIQQSHFFTTDLFVNTFSMLAIWFAVEIVMWRDERPEMGASVNLNSPISNSLAEFFRHPLFLYSLGFGVAYGMALASKVNIYPLAVLLPGAFAVRYLTMDRRSQTIAEEDASAVNGPSSTVHGPWSLITAHSSIIIACLLAGGLAAVIAFRIFQPYAFDGLMPDERWVADIQQQRAQATGEADMPWNLQWARRSHLYSFTNLTVWGLGLPLGILAWIGFLYMGWRILRGERQHVLLWGWTAAYFFWQSMQFNPTMRYQLPIYPMLAMMAAWMVFELAGGAKGLNVETFKRSNLRTALASILGITVLILTAAWAFAFQSIYLREEPRVAASRWIFQNIPGPINLPIQQEGDVIYNQPVSFPTGVYIHIAQPYQTAFTAQRTGLLEELSLAHVLAVPNTASAELVLTLWDDLNNPQPLASASLAPSAALFSSDTAQLVNFAQAANLNASQTYYVKMETTTPDARVQVCGSMQLMIQAGDQVIEQIVSPSAPCTVSADGPYLVAFTPQVSGSLNLIQLEQVTNTTVEAFSTSQTLSVVISDTPESTLASASVTGRFAPVDDPRGDAVTLELDTPIVLVAGSQYFLRFDVPEGAITLSGAAVANETSFDYGLPMRTDGYDAFGGLYRGDLNLEVYWDDNVEKLERFVTTLDQTDYIFIPTNHQYAQISRVPERYPLTAYYYRELLGCPPELETIPCYFEAQPGDYEGRLGFELAAVFETYPRLNLPLLGEIEINDQYAEEAFTFYDHPKVFIFKKRANFDPEQVRASLSTVDLTKVVRLLPTQFDDYTSLLLPPDRLETQRTGGTWSDLFDYDWLQNSQPILGLLLWYVFIFVLGLAVYPLMRVAMPGLADKGYPLSRALGLVLFGYLAWLTGSANVPVTRLTLTLIFGLLLLIGVVLGYLQRDQHSAEWKTHWKYFLMVEGLFLAFFLFDLFIRLGNPDLWHPAKGGERPMDFSYFNAILKSTTFPPFDPWYAGGYINYYYYGFVLVGVPVKLLGIVPSIAYNFILPTLFAVVALCAFSIGWNLLADRRPQTADNDPSSIVGGPFIAGLAAAFLTVVLGNLGTIQLIYNRLQQLGSLGTFSWESTFVQRLTWAIEGVKMMFAGAALPIGPGDWYWDPSRVVPPGPGNAITEFPLFTFIYSDLHAHMMVLPIALLALAWALSMAGGHTWKQNQASPAREPEPVQEEKPEPAANHRSTSWGSLVITLLFGGLIIGAAYPANLSDAYTYLLIGMIALVYAVWSHAPGDRLTKIVLSVGGVVALYVLSTYLYQPYRAWYAQAYSALDPWKGPFTPLASYFTHWGLFLFIITAWLAWETREWMANTPLSALKRLKPYQLLIEGALIALVILVLATQFIGTSVGWVALPIAAWAGVLLLNPRMTDAKRLVLFLIGTALFITILVEVVVVRGDIGRQNTIFKFYMQAWLMLAVSAGAAVAWTLGAFSRWSLNWRAFWQTVMILLVAGAAMFTVTGTTGKIRDRWIMEAPRTFDAMTFMDYAEYDLFGERLKLSEDYRAIRWAQENIQGSPVIVEATACIEYQWCARFSMYTGLPSVVGWNWHQRQQRVFTSHLVQSRIDTVSNFYNSIDPGFTRDFLQEFDVQYIIVGQLERAAYASEGIAKFDQFDGVFWKAIYADGQTTIYEVLP